MKNESMLSSCRFKAQTTKKAEGGLAPKPDLSLVQTGASIDCFDGFDRALLQR